MKRMIAAATLGLAATACTPQQVATATSYQQKISDACAIAMPLSSAAPAIAPWIIGGCATEDAIARLALDPTSLAWVNDLINKARAPKPLV